MAKEASTCRRQLGRPEREEENGAQRKIARKTFFRPSICCRRRLDSNQHFC
jgi:hypothetical protein